MKSHWSLRIFKTLKSYIFEITSKLEPFFPKVWICQNIHVIHILLAPYRTQKSRFTAPYPWKIVIFWKKQFQRCFFTLATISKNSLNFFTKKPIAFYERKVNFYFGYFLRSKNIMKIRDFWSLRNSKIELQKVWFLDDKIEIQNQAPKSDFRWKSSSKIELQKSQNLIQFFDFQNLEKLSNFIDFLVHFWSFFDDF